MPNKLTKIIPVIKNTDEQQLVPTIWRKTLSEIVDAFKNRDYGLEKPILGVSPISVEDAAMIAKNIEDYGVQLVSLPKQTWETSACLWNGDYWEVFVDLYSEEEGASDLVLSVKVYEEKLKYIFDIHLVYVP